jgi:beta-lactamase regulating signal transducer with metallopeptidase domain
MIPRLLVRIFLATFNAAIPLGIGLYLASAMVERGGNPKNGTRRIQGFVLAMGPLLLVPAMTILAPSWTFSLLKIPSEALRIVPLASGSAPENAVSNIPAVATPAISPLWAWAAAVWIVIAVWLVLRLAMGLRAARRIEKEAVEVTDGRVLVLFSETVRGIGCHRHVGLKVSRKASSPFSLGLFRASVLLPAEMMSWPNAELGCVLRHELAHIINRDLIWRLSVRLACALMWFNPAAWVALRRLAAAQERESDRVAVGSGILPSQYAGILLKTLWRTKGRPVPAAAAMDPGADLKARLRSLLDFDEPPSVRSGKRAGRLALIVLAVSASPFLRVWDIDSVRPRTVEVARVRAGGITTGAEDAAKRPARIWLDEDTHRWGWD